MGKFLLEECVMQHSEMAKFNKSSVNTIRCITMNISKKIEIPWCFMRTGRNGSFVDNGGAGGLIIGVDARTGLVNSPGYDEYGEVFAYHPETKVRFVGTQIPAWDEMLKICKQAASEVNDMGYLSWDMAYTDNGWVVIEVNEIGQLIGPQLTMKRGIKKEIETYTAIMKRFI